MLDLKKTLVVFAGPTGVGKTEVAIEFAKQHNAEIISADSMQIYRGLDVGTAKPSPKERRYVPHHLIDCWEPERPFNLAKYIELADKAISEIWKRGKNCVIVGGTGLYIEGLLKGIFSHPSNDYKIREELKKRAESEGTEALYGQLLEVDPATAYKTKPTDGVRIIRALEVFLVTGKPISQWQIESRLKGDSYSYKLFVLSRDRKELYERINKRVDKMFENGFVEEVKRLVKSGLTGANQCMKAVGYREIFRSLSERADVEVTKEKVKKATRNYAKRQFTWFRNRLSGIFINLTGKTIEIVLDEIQKYLEIPF